MIQRHSVAQGPTSKLTTPGSKLSAAGFSAIATPSGPTRDHPQRRRHRISGRHLHVWRHSRSLPVRLRVRIDRAGERHTDYEMVVDLMAAHRMRAPAGRLAHDRSALEVLQVVAELLSARER